MAIQSTESISKAAIAQAAARFSHSSLRLKGMIRAVLFDWDGTLMDRQTCVRNCIENQFVRFADQLGSVELAEFRKLFSALELRGYIPKQVVYESMRRKFGWSLSLCEALTRDYFQVYSGFCIGFPNIVETLSLLRSRALKFAIVTNGSASFQTAAIRALQVEHMFDAIVISEAEGVRKPDRGIFDLTLRRLDVTPAEAVFIGDHPEVDIRGAQEAGMRTIWKRDDYWGPCSHADAAISELDELPGVLDRFETDRDAPLDRVPCIDKL